MTVLLLLRLLRLLNAAAVAVHTLESRVTLKSRLYHMYRSCPSVCYCCYFVLFCAALAHEISPCALLSSVGGVAMF